MTLTDEQAVEAWRLVKKIADGGAWSISLFLSDPDDKECGTITSPSVEVEGCFAPGGYPGPVEQRRYDGDDLITALREAAKACERNG